MPGIHKFILLRTKSWFLLSEGKKLQTMVEKNIEFMRFEMSFLRFKFRSFVRHFLSAAKTFSPFSLPLLCYIAFFFFEIAFSADRNALTWFRVEITFFVEADWIRVAEKIHVGFRIGWTFACDPFHAIPSRNESWEILRVVLLLKRKLKLGVILGFKLANKLSLKMWRIKFEIPFES